MDLTRLDAAMMPERLPACLPAGAQPHPPLLLPARVANRASHHALLPRLRCCSSQVPTPCAHGSSKQARRRAGIAAPRAGGGTAAAPTDVFVLDFDGVIVDSEVEVSASGYSAAAAYWPEVFAGITEEQRQQVMAGMRQARAALVKGYETMVMARMLREDPGCVPAILAPGWPARADAQLAAWGARRQLAAAFFDGFRTIAERQASWVTGQPLYPGVRDALRDCPFPFYIATSKAARRVSRLAQAALGIDLPPDSPRLFAGLLPPEPQKAAALRSISARPLVAGGARLHFVDDRLDTLKAVRAARDLDHVQCYLADWGYGTPEELAAARQLAGVRVLGLSQFNELLRWGLVMAVDDGCEPTQAEVLQGVA